MSFAQTRTGFGSLAVAAIICYHLGMGWRCQQAYKPLRAPAAALALLAVLAACSDEEPGVTREQTPPPVDAAAVPALPLDPGPLQRAGLLAAVAAAADAAAAGDPPSAANREIVGRNFELRLPFGCDGPEAREGEPDSWAGWAFDPDTGSLKLRARSESWTGTPLAKEILPTDEFDAVEGFWLGRPWTNAEDCGAASSEAGPSGNSPKATVETEQTVGIAQFHKTGASRRLRLGRRPFALTLKIDNGGPGPETFYQLVVRGRIAAYPDGQPVRCRTGAPDQRPVCLARVEFGAIQLENPANGETLANWQF